MVLLQDQSWLLNSNRKQRPMRAIEPKGFGMRACAIIPSRWSRETKPPGEPRLWVYECFCLFSSSMLPDSTADRKPFSWALPCSPPGLHLGKRRHNDGPLLGRSCTSTHHSINDFTKRTVLVLVWISKETKAPANFLQGLEINLVSQLIS